MKIGNNDSTPQTELALDHNLAHGLGNGWAWARWNSTDNITFRTFLYEQK